MTIKIDGTTSTITVSKQTGPTGPTGPQGQIGNTGAQGTQGIQGVQGLLGPTGNKGDQGNPGIQGQAGSQGATGTQGIKGDTGATGSIDTTGIINVVDSRVNKTFVDALNVDAATLDNVNVNALEKIANKNQVNGYAGLDSAGKVANAQLPSYVDDVVEYANFAGFPATGETGKIYVAIDTGDVYRWGGSSYVQINDAVTSADQATKLATARNISLTGPITGTVSFDGTADANISTTLDISGKTTSDLSEGSNLYYTDTRARSSVSATGSIAYDSGTGVFSFTQGNTDTISEGSTNLYYTDARVQTVIDSNSAGFITPSSSSALTNKTGNISQWTNDSGYITSETDSQTIAFASPVLTISGSNSTADLSSLVTGFITASSTETLTNKTLTSPKINEDVAVTSTATELNLLDGKAAINLALVGKQEGTNFTGSLLIGHATTGTLNAASNNLGIGIGALDAITSGVNNTIIGYNAGTDLLSASYNTMVGYLAGSNITTGNSNTGLGENSLGTNVTGINNTAIGHLALYTTTGSNNTSLGRHSGRLINTGANNITIGIFSGNAITSGDGNVIIGYTNPDSNTGDQQLVIADGLDGSVAWIKGDSSGNITTPATLTATTFSGSGASLTNIPNASLDNSSITVNGSAVSLGGSVTIGETKPTITSISPSTITNAESTITITGSNYLVGTQVEFINTSTGIWYPASTIVYNNGTSLTATITLSVDAQYRMRIENPDGNAVISTSNILTVSDAPTWTTASGSLGSFAGNFSGDLVTVAATSDSAVTFTETTSVLSGAGVTLSSAGVLSTTDFGGSSTSATTYNFTLLATDAEGQTAERSFNFVSTFGATGGGQFN